MMAPVHTVDIHVTKMKINNQNITYYYYGRFLLVWRMGITTIVAYSPAITHCVSLISRTWINGVTMID